MSVSHIHWGEYMSKLNRVLWSGLVLVGAACGDDVTVQPPPPPPDPVVRSVTVAPDGAQIRVTEKLKFIASVTADPGAATPTIAWSSSNTAVATVDAAGEATAVAVGSVGIRATATSGTSSASGVATLNVVSSTVTPATVSIQSFEQGGVPQNVSDLDGQVDVRVNLERGGEVVQRVELLVDGLVVGAQIFASPPVQASVPELAIEELVFSWNTAAFDATTGVPKHLNGPHSVAAKVITAQNAAGTGSPTVQVVLDNSNTAVVVLVIKNGASIADGAGLTWWTGDAEASALPVIYSVASPTISSVTFFPDGGLLNKLDAAAPFVQSWAKGTTIGTGGSGGNGSVGVEDPDFEVCASAVVNGEPTGIIGCSDDVVPDTRYDNNGPADLPEFAANPNLRQNGWINGAVGLVGPNTSATDNDWIIEGADDAGVGGYIVFLRVDATAPVTVNAANAATASATPVLPAPSLNNSDYCAVASAKDLLGNESLLPAAGTLCLVPPAGSFVATGTNHLRFGVDIAAPTIAFSGGLAALGATAGRILAATVGTEFQVTVGDAGATGVSGMLGGAPVIGTVKIFNATGVTCLVGTTAACVAAGTGASFTAAFPLVATNTVAASVIDGYFTAELLAQDAAGNQSAVISRSIVHEVAGNPGVVTNALFNVPLSGSQATFQALASDNLDLRDIQYNLTYAGGLIAPILYPVQNINATPPVPTVLQNANVSVGTTILGFMRQVEDVTANGPVTVGGQFKPNNLQAIIRDQVQASAAVNTGILAGQVTTGVSYLLAAAPQLIRSWAITNAATLVSDNAGPGAAVNPLSVTLVADAFGPTATFNAPFTRVDFYASFGGFLVQIGTGTPDITFDDGAAFGRRQRWTFSWTPGTSVGLGAISLFAIGVNGVGDALVSPVNTNITVTNP